MRNLISTIIFLISTSPVFGQTDVTTKNRFMTYAQNQAWLTTAKTLDKVGRWTEIKDRIFFTDNCNMAYDSMQYSPLVVINGVPLSVPDSLTKKDEKEILILLNLETISEIEIIDRQPDTWIFHKPFSGAVMLSVSKRTSKKLFKMK